MEIDKKWLEKMGDAEDSVGSVTAGCMDYEPTLWERLRGWLFPTKHCHRPNVDFESKDTVVVHSVTKLDLCDRLRVLMTGIVVYSVRTATENEVGRTATNSTCHIGTSKDWQ